MGWRHMWATVDVLSALRGARIAVGTGASEAAGRILAVERQTRSKGDQTFNLDTLSVVTDSGDVRSFELNSLIANLTFEAD